jgi:ubiquinol-cytochrome c reductase cytochrome b subunit
LVASILILLILPISHLANFRTTQYYPLNKILFWRFISIFLILTWIGARPVEEPFIIIGQLSTILYFSYFVLAPLLSNSWNSSLE